MFYMKIFFFISKIKKTDIYQAIDGSVLARFWHNLVLRSLKKNKKSSEKQTYASQLTARSGSDWLGQEKITYF